MAKQPVIFSNLYVNMVKAGEQSGALVDVLRRMGDHFERFAEVQSKFKSAMIYPVFVCCVGIAISIFFMTVMLPSFLKLFEGLHVQLPLTTRMLIGINNFFKHWWWVLVLVVIAVVIIFNRFRASRTRQAKPLTAGESTRPIFGKVMRLHLFGQFSRTLSTLLHNGVPVLTALEITEQIIPNSIVREAIAKARAGGDRRQDAGPAAGAQQDFPAIDGGFDQDRRGNRRRARGACTTWPKLTKANCKSPCAS